MSQKKVMFAAALLTTAEVAYTHPSETHVDKNASSEQVNEWFEELTSK